MPAQATQPGETRQARAPARSDPRRRRVQLAAAADVVGHRPGGRAPASRHSAGGAPRAASERTSRTATKSPSSTAWTQPWDMLRGATFTDKDPQYQQWNRHARGIYTTNGVPALRHRAVDRHAAVARPVLLRAARATFAVTSRDTRRTCGAHPNYLTWVVLKGHTNNTAGRGDARVARSARSSGRSTSSTSRKGPTRSGDDLTAVVRGRLARPPDDRRSGSRARDGGGNAGPRL